MHAPRVSVDPVAEGGGAAHRLEQARALRRGCCGGRPDLVWVTLVILGDPRERGPEMAAHPTQHRPSGWGGGGGATGVGQRAWGAYRVVDVAVDACHQACDDRGPHENNIVRVVHASSAG
jgi:hypothetical protein